MGLADQARPYSNKKSLRSASLQRRYVTIFTADSFLFLWLSTVENGLKEWKMDAHNALLETERQWHSFLNHTRIFISKLRLVQKYWQVVIKLHQVYYPIPFRLSNSFIKITALSTRFT